MNPTTVAEIMTRDVQSCNATDSCDRAARLMWDHDCGVLPVRDPKGNVVGMVTDRDICMAAYLQGKPVAQIPVSAVSAFKVCSVHPEDSVEAAEEVMKRHRVRRLAVLDRGGNLVGLLSLADILRRGRCTQEDDPLDVAHLGSVVADVFRPHCCKMQP